MRVRRPLAAASAAATLVAAAACMALAPTAAAAGSSAATKASGTASTGAATAAISTTAPCGALPAASAPATFSHVVLVMFENKTLTRIIGNTALAPYLNSLASACSYGTKDSSLSQTSLANYVALTSGYVGCSAADAAGTCTKETPITTNLSPTTWPQASKSLFEMMDSNAVEWAESMPSNCLMIDNSADFVNNHSPYQYYTRTQPGSADPICPKYNVPFPASGSLGTMASAQFNLVIPNKTDIMHLVSGQTQDQLVKNGDNWAKTAIPQLLATPEYQSGDTAIVITWDEGNATNVLVPLIVISPYTKAGGVSTVTYNHYSVLKGIQQMVGYGSPLLGHAADAGLASIRDDALFSLKPASGTTTVPSAPTGLTATAGNASVALSWGAPASDGGAAVSTYTLYRDSGTGYAAITTSSSTSFTDTGLTNGSAYSYRVSATNSVGEGPQSAPVTATPSGSQTATVPAAPVLSGTATTGHDTLTWTAPADGGSPLTGYVVLRNGVYLHAVSGGATLSYDDTTGTVGTTYTYTVRAQNAVGKSPVSNQVPLVRK